MIHQMYDKITFNTKSGQQVLNLWSSKLRIGQEVFAWRQPDESKTEVAVRLGS